MFRPSIVAAVVAFVTGAVFAEDVRLEDPAKWIRLEAGPIVVLTDAGPRRAAAVAREIATFRTVLERTTRNLDATSDRKTVVYLFRDAKAMAPFRSLRGERRSAARGWFFRYDGVNHVIVNATPERHIESTRATRTFVYPNRELFHEWAHVVMSDNFPQLPLWVNEGIAEYFSTMYIDGRFAEVGRAPVYRAFDAALGEPMPIAIMLRMRDVDTDLSDDEQVYRFYSQSWALVHYFLRGGGLRKKEFGLFLGALKVGTPQQEAWTQSFTATPAEVLREALAYVKPGHFTFVRYPLAEMAPSEPSEPKSVAAADLLTELGGLALLSRRDRPDQAGARFEAAIAIDPRHVPALRGLAQVRMAQERKADAERLLHEAEAAAAGAPASAP